MEQKESRPITVIYCDGCGEEILHPKNNNRCNACGSGNWCDQCSIFLRIPALGYRVGRICPRCACDYVDTIQQIRDLEAEGKRAYETATRLQNALFRRELDAHQ